MVWFAISLLFCCLVILSCTCMCTKGRCQIVTRAYDWGTTYTFCFQHQVNWPFSGCSKGGWHYLPDNSLLYLSSNNKRLRECTQCRLLNIYAISLPDFWLLSIAKINIFLEQLRFTDKYAWCQSPCKWRGSLHKQQFVDIKSTRIYFLRTLF